MIFYTEPFMLGHLTSDLHARRTMQSTLPTCIFMTAFRPGDELPCAVQEQLLSNVRDENATHVADYTCKVLRDAPPIIIFLRRACTHFQGE